MKNLFKSKKGFTLVEIVIVIAIIGLLMIILIPSAINAFKNNRLQGAKIAAQRVASSLEAGIGSGKIPLTSDNATSMGAEWNTTTKQILAKVTSDNAVSIANIAGINNIYNLPSNNADLVDPLGSSNTESENYFRCYWQPKANNTNFTYSEAKPVGKVFIINSVSAASDAITTDDTTGRVIYANSGDDLRNPDYK